MKKKYQRLNSNSNGYFWTVVSLALVGVGGFITSILLSRNCYRQVQGSACTLRSWNAANPLPPNCTAEFVGEDTSSLFSFQSELLIQSIHCKESQFSAGYCESSYDDICSSEESCLLLTQPSNCTIQTHLHNSCFLCDKQLRFIVSGSENCNEFYCYDLGQAYEIVHGSPDCNCPSYCQPLALGCPSDTTRLKIDGWFRGLKTPLGFISLLIIVLAWVIRPVEINPIVLLQRFLNFITLITTIVFFIAVFLGHCESNPSPIPNLSLLVETKSSNWFDPSLMFPNLNDDRDDPVICPTGAFYFFLVGIVTGLLSYFFDRIFICF